MKPRKVFYPQVKFLVRPGMVREETPDDAGYLRELPVVIGEAADADPGEAGEMELMLGRE